MQNPMTACPHCGAQISANAQFCKACGKSVVAPTGVPRAAASPIAHKCPDCGAPLSETAQFCKACGTSIAAEPTDAPHIAAPPVERKCPACGAALSDTAQFCKACGAAATMPSPASRPFPAKPVVGIATPRAISRNALLLSLSGLALVCICLVVGLVASVSLQGIPTSLSPFNPVAAPKLEQPLEQVTLTGKLVLPSGTALTPAKIRIISNTSNTSVNTQGEFSIPALRGATNTTLAIAVNDNGNGVLLRTTRGDKTKASPDVSAISTARALVLYDLAILTLPPQWADRAETLAEQHSAFPNLVRAIEEAIRKDPADPLNEDTHADLFQQASQITADLLKKMQGISRNVRPPGLARLSTLDGLDDSTTAGPPSVSSLAATCTTEQLKYIRVEDEVQHSQPSVYLYNNSFAYYNVGVTKDGKPWSDASGRATVLLPRSKAYQVAVNLPAVLINNQTQWPLSTGNSNRINPDDGKLAFEFKMDEDLSFVDFAMTIFAAAYGLPAANVAGLDTNFLAAFYGLKEVSATYREYRAAIEQAKGRGLSEVLSAGKQALLKRAVWIGLAGAHVYGRAVAGETFVTLAVKILGKKAAVGLTVGYASADIAMMVWSQAYAPRACSVDGIQKFGRFPYEPLLSVDPPGIPETPLLEITFKAQLKPPPQPVKTVTFVWSLEMGGNLLQMGEEDTVQRGATDFRVTHTIRFPSAGKYTLVVQALDADARLLRAPPIDEVKVVVQITPARTPVSTATPTATATKTAESKGGAWVLEKLDLKKNVPKDSPAIYQGQRDFNHSVVISNGSATISRDWDRNGWGDYGYCKGHQESTHTWTPLPARLTPGESIVIKLSVAQQNRGNCEYGGGISTYIYCNQGRGVTCGTIGSVEGSSKMGSPPVTKEVKWTVPDNKAITDPLELTFSCAVGQGQAVYLYRWQQ